MSLSVSLAEDDLELVLWAARMLLTNQATVTPGSVAGVLQLAAQPRPHDVIVRALEKLGQREGQGSTKDIAAALSGKFTVSGKEVSV